MGVYYIIANHARRQWVEPGKVRFREGGGDAIKMPGVMYGAAAKVAETLWSGDEIEYVPDTGERDWDIMQTYTEVTEEFQAASSS